jgi:hypothetical protein
LLERDIAAGPEQRMPAGLNVPTAVGAQPPRGATPSLPPITEVPSPAADAPQGVRTFRITIGGMEFAAEVEEVPE